MSTALRSAPSEEAAVEALHAASWTDGLPVVVPTPERVDRMVLAGGLDPDLVLATIGPSGAAATVEKIAVNAVMAGCLPDAFPVVLAAVRAVTDEAFDLHEVQATTHGLAPLLIVNGPARRACAIASGFGALGPGHRANATIGRALRLVLMNIGGARPGVGDMAVLGHGSKFTYCLAEAEEESPFAPLHTTRGFTADESAVTVAGVEAPHSVMCMLVADDPHLADRLLDLLAGTIANVGSNTLYAPGGTTVVCLNPEHARVLADAGLDRHDVIERLRAATTARRGDLLAHNPSPLIFGDPDDEVQAIADEDRLLLVVAGGPGFYSFVMPPWGAGSHSNSAVSRPVVLDEVC
ncbi:MAG: hypothetical protein AB7L84_12360 [Acidimicrobiia bacterium]